MHCKLIFYVSYVPFIQGTHCGAGQGHSSGDYCLHDQVQRLDHQSDLDGQRQVQSQLIAGIYALQTIILYS